MFRRTSAVKSMLLLNVFTGGMLLRGQARPTATEPVHLSAFGGVTGTAVGLNSAKNGSITAGLDLGFRSYFSLYPSIEVRGSYPVYSGRILDQRSVLAGVKVERPFGRLHPYANLLFGRGGIDYQIPYPDPGGFFYYTRSVTNVLSPGVGLDYDLSRQLAFKIDAQYQRFNTPVTLSGHIESKALTLAGVYRFDFNRHFRRRR